MRVTTLSLRGPCVQHSRPCQATASANRTLPRYAHKQGWTSGNAKQSLSRDVQVHAAPRTRKAIFPNKKPTIYDPLSLETSSTEDKCTITVTVPASTCMVAKKNIITELRKTTDVQGFNNPSKVPEVMLISAAGTEKFKYACIEEIMRLTMADAFEGQQENLLDGSQKVVSSIQEMVEQFDATEPFTYVVTGEYGDMGLEYSAPYTGIKIEVEAVLNQALEDASVKNAVNEILKKNGGRMVVSSKGLMEGDTCVIAFDVQNTDGTSIPGLQHDRYEVDTATDREFLVPAVAVAMMGMVPGEKRTIPFTFPDVWDPVALQNTEALIEVSMTEVFQWELPELTLEIAQTVTPDVDSVEGFLERARDAVRFEGTNALQESIHSAILGHLQSITSLRKYPETHFMAFAMSQYESQLTQSIERGEIPQDKIKELATEEVAQLWIEGRMDILQSQFRLIIVLEDIFVRENLELDHALMKEQVASHLANNKSKGVDYDMEAVENYVRSELANVSTLAFLQESGEVTIRPLVSPST